MGAILHPVRSAGSGGPFPLDAGLTAAALDVLKGEHLGGGSFRDVYALSLDPTKVLKVEYADYPGDPSFHNVGEWLAWQELKDTEHARWLAPCHSIDRTGRALVMERTQPCDELPEMLPSFLTDVKPANMGWLGRGRGRRLVCHDYGYNTLHLLGARRSRMVRSRRLVAASGHG